MLVKQLYIDNTARNFNYLIICTETGEALAVDPLDADLCLATAQANQWKITQVVNTHEHWDHIGGNKEILAATQAKLLAHYQAKIPNITEGLHAEDIITIGKSIKLKILDTPGHTMTHICLFNEDKPTIFSGDTLFNAGCGNCKNGGYPEALFKTFNEQLFKLPKETKIYPGHDYIVKNLEFSLSREPQNKKAKELLAKVSHQDPHSPYISTIKVEEEINPFFRLNSREIIEQLRKDFPTMAESPNAEEIFLLLRELRNTY